MAAQKTGKNLVKFLDIAQNYDAFLLDLWGVIHDGSALYPGVGEALKTLAEKNKKIIFLSNAPRRAAKVKRVLAGFGIAENSYLDVVTSGEAGHQWLAKNSAGQKYFFIGSDRDLDVMDDLPCTRVHTLEEADFLLNVGFTTEPAERIRTDEMMHELPAAVTLGLPMLCLNPDLEVVKITGERFPCAGVIAKEYERIGGQVRWFGKPHDNVYQHCFHLLAGMPKNKILGVGDSLDTDISGAKNAGIDSVLITGGILHQKTAQEIAALCEQANLSPTFTLPTFG
ncbi:MAG: TIGR01459 family HAD-type hydrolase [Alphaproteobacteria bacterium]|nr:TIGR01459 family HAD-type hydrolase [Alphaproteobacteria bacterium]